MFSHSLGTDRQGGTRVVVADGETCGEQHERIQQKTDWRTQGTQVKLALVPIMLLAFVGGPLCAIGAGVVTAGIVAPLCMASPCLALLTSAAGALAALFCIVRRRRI